MTLLHNERQLDDIGWQILKLLQENARQSLRQIGVEPTTEGSSLASSIECSIF